MIITAHQPHYLPWSGYISRMNMADKFIVMDNMEFTSYSYINRNRIIQDGKILQLSLPVKNKRSLHKKISDIELDYSHCFRGTKKHLKSIEYNYFKREGFQAFFPKLEPILQKKYKWLLDINIDIIVLIKDYLNINSEILLASDLGIEGRKEDELFLSLLSNTGADEMLLGMGASTKYINVDNVVKGGGNLVYQKFNHPIYPQSSGEFIKGVSIIDLLMNVSQKKAIELINRSSKIEKRS